MKVISKGDVYSSICHCEPTIEQNQWLKVMMNSKGEPTDFEFDRLTVSDAPTFDCDV